MTGKCDLRFPFVNYDGVKRFSINSPDEYRKLVPQFVSKNQSEDPMNANRLNDMMNLLRGNEPNGVREWMINHVDRIRYVCDLSGLAFGIVIREYPEEFSINSPYKDYSSNDNWFIKSEWNKLDLIGKLNWLHENCDFIPIIVIYESLYRRDESIGYTEDKEPIPWDSFYIGRSSKDIQTTKYNRRKLYDRVEEL